jgi:hypothetical protein
VARVHVPAAVMRARCMCKGDANAAVAAYHSDVIRIARRRCLLTVADTASPAATACISYAPVAATAIMIRLARCVLLVGAIFGAVGGRCWLGGGAWQGYFPFGGDASPLTACKSAD